jgi:tRNA-specific 2-thiouridylase
MTLMAPSLEPWAPKQAVSRQIAVLMSGGVDSSVTAHLLLQAGWDVVGITMKIPVACDTGKRGCCGADAAFVSQELGMAHYFVDVTDAFHQLIIDPFQQAYAQAKTPNPCIDCNTFLKFQLVWDLLEKELGIRYVATGHYAQVLTAQGKARLCRGRDRHKDQSYFLYGIRAERLPYLTLPLGGLAKQEVRAVAAEIGLSVAEKAESMELCFAGEGDYRDALAIEQAQQEGDLTDMQGQRIGTHKGIANYTLGQRKGLGFAGGQPLYVGRIDAQTNTVALGTRAQVCQQRVWAGQMNILDREGLVPGQPMWAKIRSYGDPRPCVIRTLEQGVIEVEFTEPQFAPCPGQRLVLYNSESCVMAGGNIFLPAQDKHE